ncbi:hypothetical protein [Sulfitobacter sp. SK012]|uniref:hypothetical protein n=1 Tax=Sulfitobacter sp. SK012 TaxID=1389005 RepID=UPI0013B447D6|nr:hypothetical protein [Sulfitobacter sp. SK012]
MNKPTDPSVIFDLPAPIEGSWQTLPATLADMLDQRLREFGAHDEVSDILGLRVLPLAFRPGWMLCDFQEGAGNGPHKLHSVIYGPDGVSLLDGSSAPLHQGNIEHGIDLSDATKQAQYLRLFCMFVRGEYGPFEIVQSAQGLTFEKGVSAIFNRLTPVENDAGDMLWRATVHYNEALFDVEFLLHPDGQVTMKDDTHICDGVTRDPELNFAKTARYRSPQGQE